MADKKGFFSQILSWGGNVAEVASHAHSATDLLGGLFGKKDSGGSANKKAEGLYGTFGKGDEREYQRILTKFRKDNPDGFEIFFDFVGYHYRGDPNNRFDLRRAKRERDALRMLIVKMDPVKTGPSERTTTERTTRNRRRGDVKTEKIVREIFGDTSPDAIAFLSLVADMVVAGQEYYEGNGDSEIGALHKAYGLIAEYFRQTGVPHMPLDGETDWLHAAEHVWILIKDAYPGVKNSFGEMIRREQNRKIPLTEKIARAILPF